MSSDLYTHIDYRIITSGFHISFLVNYTIFSLNNHFEDEASRSPASISLVASYPSGLYIGNDEIKVSMRTYTRLNFLTNSMI